VLWFFVAQAEWLLFAPLLIFYVIVPLFDLAFGNARDDGHAVSLREASQRTSFDAVLYFAALNVIIVFIGNIWFLATAPLSWVGIVAQAFSTGLALGFAYTVSHELGHKHFWFKRKLGLALGALGWYGHFSVEHNHGHHRDVATAIDSASSRMGESIWQFAPRELSGAFTRAWRMERERMQREGRATLSLHNEVVQGWLMSALLYAALIAWLGVAIIPALVVIAFWGAFQLTSANYVEHYGLLRKTVDGKTEPCRPRHSWNSNHLVSNLLLFHLQRHSDHHTYPARPYQALRSYQDVPTLPLGYFAMFVLAYLPPLWFRVMDARLVREVGADAANINFRAQQKNQLVAKFQLAH
jgi:alkane 1-monooxygenase